MRRLHLLAIPALLSLFQSTSASDPFDGYHARVAPCKRVLHSESFSLNVRVGGDLSVPGRCETQKVVTGSTKGKRTQIEIRYVCQAQAPKAGVEPLEFHARRIIHFSAQRADWRPESAVLDVTGLPPKPSEIRTKPIPLASLGPLVPLATACVGAS